MLQNMRQPEESPDSSISSREPTDYNAKCEPASLPSPSFMSAEASNLHSIVLDSMKAEELSPLDEEMVVCSEIIDNDVMLEEVDHVYCAAAVRTEHSSNSSRRSTVRKKRPFLSGGEDLCRTKRSSLEMVASWENVFYLLIVLFHLVEAVCFIASVSAPDIAKIRLNY